VDAVGVGDHVGIRRAVALVVAVLALGTVAPASAAAAGTGGAQQEVDASGAAAPLVVPVAELPYRYHSEEQIYTRNSSPLPRITTGTRTVRIELTRAFLLTGTDTLDWHIWWAPRVGGTVAIDRSSGTVEIPLPAGLEGKFETEVPRALDLELRASTPVPADVPRPTAVPVGNYPLALEVDWLAIARYQIRFDPAAAPSAEPVDLPLSKQEILTYAETQEFAAILPDDRIIVPGTVLKFQAPRPIFEDKKLQYVPEGVVSAPWGQEGYLPNGFATPRTTFTPVLDSSLSSVTVDFARNAAVLTPFLSDNGVVAIRAGIGNQHGQSHVTLVARVGSDTTVPGVRSTRVAGPNRIDGAMISSALAYPEHTESLYLASSYAFGDALSAGPAALADGAPVLIGGPGSVGGITADGYVHRLNPSRIVVVGGTTSISDQAVEDLIHAAALDRSKIAVTRAGGADRYEASRATAAAAFAGGADTAFLATGAKFSDALSSVSAASTVGAPVILIRGNESALDAPTLALLKSLGVSKIVLSGGPARISTGIERSLTSMYPGAVTRYGGADRFEVSAAINRAHFPSASRVYLATGAGFADALTGGVLAGSKGAPLVLSRPECVPAVTLQLLKSQGAVDVTLVGGIKSLSSDVAALKRC
jgi:putative cell wall-binding protein